jgi:TonB-linked SusC/RagA family outer membrane protein
MILLLVGMLQVSASVYSQNGKISVDVKEMELSDLLWELQESSGIVFVYKTKDLKGLEKVTVSKQNSNLQEVLDEVLEGTGLEYVFNEDVVSIKREAVKPIQEEDNERKVSGKVVDSSDTPLPGVSVLLKGTYNGVASDLDGKFSIKIPERENIILVFSFVGMESQEVVYEGQKHIKVVMKDGASGLDEVVVTGYQEINKERMTGSVETVTADKIVNKGYTTLVEAMKGGLAGVSMMNLSGRPGAAPQIRIRGINTLTGDAEPIWIVDGMPMQGDLPKIDQGGTAFTNSVLTNGIGNIPVDDIKSITVLKDAAATAIYGSRAANGVIVIETKRGRVGKSYINYSGSYSINEAPRNSLPMMNSAEKIQLEKSLYEDFGHRNDLRTKVFDLSRFKDRGLITEEEYKATIDRLSNTNTDWYDVIFRTAKTQTHNISLSGGSEKTQYYASLNYLDEQGIVPNNQLKRYGASVKLTNDFNEKLRVNLDLNFSYKKDQTTASIVNPLEYATFANPYERPYDDNGNYVYDSSYDMTLSSFGQLVNQYDLNILKDLNENTKYSDYLNSGLNFSLEYELLDGLMFKSAAQLSSSWANTRTEMMPGSYTSEKTAWIKSAYGDFNNEIPNSMNKGSLREQNVRALSYTFRNTLNYNKYIHEDHLVNVLVGNEIMDSENRSFYNLNPEYNPLYQIVGVPKLDDFDPKALRVRDLGGTSFGESKAVSYFANGSYSYKDKYIAQASIRWDGVDIIGTNNRFTPLWNVSMKYNMHKEDFMSSVPWINQLSLRASYGFTGSIDRNARPFAVVEFTDGNRTYNGEFVPKKMIPANPSVKWQKKEDKSFGLSLSVLKNRINLNYSYYNNTLTDLLETVSTPPSTGRSEIRANVASLKKYRT